MLKMFLKFLRESFRDLIPIVVVIVFFQLVILGTVPENWVETTIWMSIVWFGLAVFLMWLEYWIFPIWKSLTKQFAQKKSHFWMMAFWFLVGFSTTIAEPALLVIAEQASTISGWAINAQVLRYIVALSVGFAIWLGIWRIIKWYPIHYFIIAWYLLVVWITYFTPHEIVGLAYDLGWITTSTVTVPLVAAIWIWLSASIKWRNPAIDWFGLIAFASLTPMLLVQVYWIFIYNFWDTTATKIVVEQTAEVVKQVSQISDFLSLSSIFQWLLSTLKDVAPILLTIFFFQYIIIRKIIPIRKLKPILIGFGMVILWLYSFILGLEMWLFSLGENMAKQLVEHSQSFDIPKNEIIYLFAFLIWFSTTMAEPTLIAIANKAWEISDGKIQPLILRIFVALWVWFWITLWTYRIIYWDFIHNYIIVGYIIVIALTYFAPKYIVPIAYDSGWVTTSTITVPLVAALWIWLATNIDWRDPLLDWFGLIAFASLFPIITVMWYWILSEYVQKKKYWRYREEEDSTLSSF